MTRLLGSLLLVAGAGAFTVGAAPAPRAAVPLDQVIPAPASVRAGGSPYRITSGTHIRVDDSAEARQVGAYLADILRPSTGYRLPLTTQGSGGIRLRLAKGAYGDEGYRLDSGSKGVTITAGKSAGLFHGLFLREGRIQAGARPVQPAPAHLGQLLAPLPERQGLLQRRTARLEPSYDLDQLVPCLLVAERLIHLAGHPPTLCIDSNRAAFSVFSGLLSALSVLIRPGPP